MEKQITKTKISISIDKRLDDILNEEFANKSKYIEWLIYQDLLKNSNSEKLLRILL